jgi:hypothetical protein
LKKLCIARHRARLGPWSGDHHAHSIAARRVNCTTLACGGFHHALEARPEKQVDTPAAQRIDRDHESSWAFGTSGSGTQRGIEAPMDIDVFAPTQLGTVFRVLRTILEPERVLDSAQRSFLSTYARITDFQLPPIDPRPIPIDEVLLDGAHPKKRLIQLGAMAALLARPINPASVAYLRALCEHLETHDSVVDLLEALIAGHTFKAKMLARRRGFRAILKEAFLAEGAMGVVRFFAAFLFKARVNVDKHWRYRRLGLLPHGTLGRAYWQHMTEQGFGFPGEPAGIADSVAYHDVGHVLTGYDTTPAGEIQQGSFQGGNRREDGFFFILFVILQFHQGIAVSPNGAPEVGHFDPAKVLWAIHRGASCEVDITHQWKFWPLLTLSVEQARAECALIA